MAALAWLVLLLGLALTLRPALAQTADTIDVNAVLHVTVAGEPDLSGDYRVDTDGNIQMLYVNRSTSPG